MKPHLLHPISAAPLGMILCGLALLTACGQPEPLGATPPPTSFASTAAAGISTPEPEFSPLPRPTISPLALTRNALKAADLTAEAAHDATRAAISPAPMSTDLPTYPPEPTEALPFGISTFQECGGG